MRHQFFANFHSFIYGPVDFAWLTTSQVLLRVLQILRYVCVYKERRRRSSQNFPCSSNRPQNRSSVYIFWDGNMRTHCDKIIFLVLKSPYQSAEFCIENVDKQLNFELKM